MMANYVYLERSYIKPLQGLEIVSTIEINFHKFKDKKI